MFNEKLQRWKISNGGSPATLTLEDVKNPIRPYLVGEGASNPDTDVMICSNVPLDNTYQDTLTFNSAAEQAAYFYGKAEDAIVLSTFQRDHYQVRYPAPASYIDHCNYICYRNNTFDNKWYYGFITSVEYSNPNVSIIHFEIDVMQTWMFEYEVKTCFVEREHVLNDNPYINIIPEDIEIGPLIQNGGSPLQPFDLLDNMMIVVQVAEVDDTSANGKRYSGIYSGSTLYGWLATDWNGVNAFIGKYVQGGQAQRIQAIYMCPNILTLGAPGGGAQLAVGDNYKTVTKNVFRAKTLAGYLPKNNKLWSYPYSRMRLYNGQGDIIDYRYELFGSLTHGPQIDNDYEFVLKGAPNYPVSCIVSPSKYNNSVESEIINGMPISGWPLCGWTYSAYENYLGMHENERAVNRVTNSIGNFLISGFQSPLISQPSGSYNDTVRNPSILGSVLNSAANLEKGGIGPMASAAGSIVDVFAGTFRANAQAEDLKKMPPGIGGSLASNALLSIKELTYSFYDMCLTNSYAKRIDKYFSAYGYKVNEFKVPNLKTRPSWNYVKTIGSVITGSVPFNDISLIRRIFDKGITFWHGDWVGDYNRANGETPWQPGDPPVDPGPDPEPGEGIIWGAPFTDWQSHVTSEYGLREDPLNPGTSQFHHGIDIAFPTGTAIMAIADGTVISWNQTSGRGIYVDVKVDDEFTYRYQHLNVNGSVTYPIGTKLTRGKQFAYVGATGDVTGPHLHLEILQNLATVNPRPYIDGSMNPA